MTAWKKLNKMDIQKCSNICEQSSVKINALTTKINFLFDVSIRIHVRIIEQDQNTSALFEINNGLINIILFSYGILFID